MGPDVRSDLRKDKLAEHGLSPFAPPQAQHAPASIWSAPPAASHAVVPAPTPEHVAAPAAATHVASPGRLASLWDGAKGMGNKAYHKLTDWNFEGRDGHNGKAPTQEEIDKDPAWRLMGAKESIYHNNNIGLPERKYVRDDPNSRFGGLEAVIDGDTNKPMEAGPYQATYNYCNPAKGGIKDFSAEGIARNLGHMALDVVPYWFGGTVRGDEGTNFAQRMLGPETYKKAGEKWDGVKSGVGGALSKVGRGLSAGWHGLTGWGGAKHEDPEAQHDR